MLKPNNGMPTIEALFKKAVDNPDTELRETVCLLVVGARGDGKSTCIGTATGNVLLITTSDEAHSVPNAMAIAERTYGATIAPFIIDMDEDNNPLNEDLSYTRLNALIDQLTAMPKPTDAIQWLALDSMFSIFKKINNTTKINTIKAAKNHFRAQEVALQMLLDLNQKLVALSLKNVNIVVTCPAACEQDKTTGLYNQIEPLLEGYRNNLHMVGMWPDIAVVTKARFETDDGERFQHIFQLGGANIEKSGKKAATGEQRTTNFKPRINGLLMDETPDILDADLTKFAKFKRKMRIKRQKNGSTVKAKTKE